LLKLIVWIALERLIHSTEEIITVLLLRIHLLLHLGKIKRRREDLVERKTLLETASTLDWQTKDHLGSLVGNRGQMNLAT
jgi:hypothetical protein